MSINATCSANSNAIHDSGHKQKSLIRRKKLESGLAVNLLASIAFVPICPRTRLI